MERLLKNSENEKCEKYSTRIKKELPLWPNEVIKEWLYRHNNQIEDYYFLGFENFEFSLEEWDIEKIYKEIGSFKLERVIDGLGSQFFDYPEKTYLKTYIQNNKTWPSPIIILKNDKSIYTRYNEKLGEPYHLLEGHLRLGYIRHLYKLKKEINSKHLVYIVNCK